MRINGARAQAETQVCTTQVTKHMCPLNTVDTESPCHYIEFHVFTPKRFHVLLNSLLKVLFNFPSRYLFAIGLVVIFSLRWSIPPT